MLSSNQVIDTWIFEYLAHTCIKEYFEDGCNSVILRGDHILHVLTSYLNEGRDGLTCREYVCLLFLHLLCMEEDLAKDESQTKCDYIGTDNFRKSMPKQIAFASRDSKNENTKKLARHCLIETHVVIFKYCLRDGAGWEEALKEFETFVTLMPIDECQAMYDECCKMKGVEPDDDFISEYLDLIRHLVLTLYSDFDDPYLIKLALRKGSLDPENEMDIEQQDTTKNLTSISEAKAAQVDSRLTQDVSERDKNLEGDSTSEDDIHMEGVTSDLKVLLRDTRHSRMSDLEEIKLEESDSLTRMRKKVKDFDALKHLDNVVRLERRIRRKPPSHQSVQGGPWMVDEERAFIRKALEIGIGRWRDIKTALNTFRSTQQLKDKWRLIKPWQLNEVKKEMKMRKGSSH